MRVGIVGLGRIGGNLARQAMRERHEVVGWTLDHHALTTLGEEGMVVAESLEDVATQLSSPRVILAYVPQRAAVDLTVDGLRPHPSAGDVLVDGGNSNWNDAGPRAPSCTPDRPAAATS